MAYNYGQKVPGDPKYKIGDTVFFILDMTQGGEKIIHRGEIFCVLLKKDFKGGIAYSYSVRNLTQVISMDEDRLYDNFMQALHEAKREQGDIDECGA